MVARPKKNVKHLRQRLRRIETEYGGLDMDPSMAGRY